jgi:hypothetical protein
MYVIGSTYQNYRDEPKKFGVIWATPDGFRFCASNAYPLGLKDYKTLDCLTKDHNLVSVIINKI